MDYHPWFQRLRKELRKQHVPTRYANRLLNELWFHYLEMKEEEKMNGFIANEASEFERLGSPEKLAEQAAMVPRATWSGRHPWLAFILGAPAITFGLILVSVLAAVFVLVPFAEGKTLASDPWLGPLMTALGPMQVIVPSIIGCILVCRWVDRSVRSPWWGVVSCGLVAVLCTMTFVHWVPDNATPGTGKMSMYIGPPIVAICYQAIVPLTIGVVFAIRNLLPSRLQSQKTSTTISIRAAA